MALQINKPRGTKDILPDEQKYWSLIEDAVKKRLLSFDFGKITTPTFEFASLFDRSVGKTTDIVQKEMYEIKKFGSPDIENPDEKLALRPEGTAGIIRSYIEKGMQVWPQPVKLYYLGPMFRYDRPQKGRYREFWQFGIEIIGDKNPQTDVITIMLAWQILNDLGLTEKDIIIDINSIGCKICRPKINKALLEYLQKYENLLCPLCQTRLKTNPLRILDCKEEKCQTVIAGAPQIIEYLCSSCKDDFKQVLEGLDDLSIPYNFNPRLTRGLDYYTKTAFEVIDLKDDQRQSSLLGGGRYDNLIEMIGGQSTPGIGFAGGIERIINKIKEVGVKIPEIKKTEIFIIQLGEKAQKNTLKLIYELSNKGFAVSTALGKNSLKSQLKAAGKCKASVALIIGQREALDNSVIIKDLSDSSQESIPMQKLDQILYKKLRS